MVYVDMTKFTNKDIEREFLRNFRVPDGYDGVEVYSAIKICKNNLNALLNVVFESGLGYGSEDEFDDKMIDAFESIKTVKGFKEFIKEFEICDLYYLKVYKGYLVDYFPK